MRNVPGLTTGEWRQVSSLSEESAALYNGHPYYYNSDLDLYLYMVQPYAATNNNDRRQFYTVHANLGDSSVGTYGYCGEAGLDIMDCGARWHANMIVNSQARFEACSSTQEA